MRLLETYFWVALYWAAYLPVSFVLRVITEQGDILGILLIGVLFTVVLTVFLAFQDDLLFERWEPAIVHYTPAPPSKSRDRPALVKKPKPVPAPESVQPLEVKTHAKEKEPKSESTDSARFDIGLEPWPKMRTDVDLGKLDAADDDILG